MFADTEKWMLSSCLARFWKSENLFQVAHYRVIVINFLADLSNNYVQIGMGIKPTPNYIMRKRLLWKYSPLVQQALPWVWQF